MTYDYKYHRYQLINPYIGNTIYRSKSINTVAEKCYSNLKNIRNIKYIREGLFIIIDLNDNIKYKFQNNINKKINLYKPRHDNIEYK